MGGIEGVTCCGWFITSLRTSLTVRNVSGSIPDVSTVDGRPFLFSSLGPPRDISTPTLVLRFIESKNSILAPYLSFWWHDSWSINTALAELRV